jgi:DNA-binding beta-propeller fold protein YncE
MNYPLGIEVTEDGTIYVADFRNDQIQVFDGDGVFLRRFPDPMTVVGRGASGQDGTGIAVTDVAVADDLVFAADTYQVVVFTTEGEFVRQFGRPGSGPGEFNHLTGIDVTPQGIVLVADSNNNRVQALSAEGEYLWSLGGGPSSSAAATATADTVTPYEFGLPRSVAVMGDGRIAVLDAFDFSIVLFTRDGELIDSYGQRGSAPGQLSFPNSIEAVGDGLLVSDRQNDRVQLLEVVR